MRCSSLTLIGSTVDSILDATLNGDVLLTCSFLNAGPRAVEGVFTVALGGVKNVVYELTVDVDGKRLVAKAMLKRSAVEKYDDALSQGFQPYLLEQDGEGKVKLSLGSVAAGATVVVTLRYLMEAALDVQTRCAQLVFPYEHEKISKMRLRLRNQRADSVACPSGHELRLADDNRLIEVVQGSGAISLELGLNGIDSLQSSLGVWEGQGAALVSFAPKLEPRVDVAPEAEIIFLVDRSGSMGGKRMTQTKNALTIFLRSVPQKTLFNIFSFGSSFQQVFPTSVELTQETFDKANEAVVAFDANLGGTQLLQPIKTIMASPWKAAARELVVLTDGEVGNTEEVIAEIALRSPNLRVFSLGLGDQASRTLILGMAKAGRGEAVFLDQGVESAVGRIMKRILCPILTNVSYDWDDLSISEVSQPSVVFSGQRLAVSLMLKDLPQRPHKVSLSCRIGGELRQFTTMVDPAQAMDGPMIHRIVVKDLCESASRDCKLVQDAIRLGLVTKHTSLIVVDETGRSTFPSEPLIQERAIAALGSATTALRSAHNLDVMHKLDETKCVMRSNIAMLLDRSEQIDRLLEQTDVLQDQSVAFRSNTKSLGSPSFTDTVSSVFSSVTSTVSDWFSPKPFFSIYSTEGLAAAPASPEPSSNSATRAPMPTPALTNSNNNNNNPKKFESSAHLVSLQQFSGCWNATFALATALGFQTLDELIMSVPEGISHDQWATALAIIALETRFSKSRDEWDLLVTKALRWLSSAGNVNLILEAARKKLA